MPSRWSDHRCSGELSPKVHADRPAGYPQGAGEGHGPVNLIGSAGGCGIDALRSTDQADVLPISL